MHKALLINILFASLLIFPSSTVSEPIFEQIINRAIGGEVQQSRTLQAVKPADLSITHFSVSKQTGGVHYTVTFKNTGQGIAGCFDYKIGDSAKGVRLEQACPSSRWLLRLEDRSLRQVSLMAG